jgi:hypothetical protein
MASFSPPEYELVCAQGKDDKPFSPAEVYEHYAKSLIEHHIATHERLGHKPPIGQEPVSSTSSFQQDEAGEDDLRVRDAFDTSIAS